MWGNSIGQSFGPYNLWPIKRTGNAHCYLKHHMNNPSVCFQVQFVCSKSNATTHCCLKHHVFNQKFCLHVLFIHGQSNTYQPAHCCRKHHMSNQELKVFLAQAALRAPHEVALQCVAGHCYYQLSLSLSFFFSVFCFCPTSRNLPCVKICLN